MLNDMPQASNLFKFILSADDTTLFSALNYLLSLDIPTSSELIDRVLSRWGMADNKLLIDKYDRVYVIRPRQKEGRHLNPPWMEKNRTSR